MPLIKTNETQINYEYIPCTSRKEKTETIILAHGLGLDMTSWDYILPYLLEHYHIVRFDFRGHGKSISHTTDVNWKLLYEDYKALISELGLSNYHYIGHGLGGHFGLELVTTFPNEIQTLSLLTTPCFFPYDLGKKELEEREQFAKKSFDFFVDSTIERICYPVTEEKYALLKASYHRCSQDIYFKLLQLILRTVSLSKLKEINIPVFLLMGELDSIYPPPLTGLGIPYLSNSRYFIIPKASNMIQIDQPQLTATYLIDFIKESKQPVSENKHLINPELTEWLQNILDDKQITCQFTNHLKLNVRKSFSVSFNNKIIEGSWNQRKAKEILTFIVLNNEATTREQLYELFWPEKPLAKAQNTLRVCLNHLKQIVGEEIFYEIFSIQNNQITLTCKTECDVDDLNNLLTQVKDTNVLPLQNQINQKLIRKLDSPFLAGFYDNWFINYRRMIEDQVLDIQFVLLEKNKSQHLYNEALVNLKTIMNMQGEDRAIIKEFIHVLSKLNKEHEVNEWTDRLNHL